MDPVYVVSLGVVILTALGTFLIVIRLVSTAQSPVQVADYARLLNKNLDQEKLIFALQGSVDDLTRKVDDQAGTITRLEAANQMLHEQVNSLYSKMFDLGGSAVVAQEQRDLTRLTEMIQNHFTVAEMAILAAAVGVDWENVPHIKDGAMVASSNLVQYCSHRRIVDKLRAECKRQRPTVDGW